MKRYVAFLRGINVSGHNLVKMDVLKEIFAMPGIKNIVTYIQSGNVVFDTRETDNTTLEQKIETQLHKELGFPVRVIVRSIEEIKQTIVQSPFSETPEKGTHKLYISLFDTIPEAEKAIALQTLCSGESEQMYIAGATLYFITPAYGNTKFSNNFVEKKLGVVATTRNWATMNKVVTL